MTTTEPVTANGLWIPPGPGEWTPDTQRKALAMLRQPFAQEAIGLLPKPYRKNSDQGNCEVCGGFHGLPALHLDFVGHAAVTDRLLTVDPWWSWDFRFYDIDGLPVVDANGGMWITLTVAEVTRLGYGDGPDPKQRIGDGIRNSGMRFGIALNLWTKDELESLVGNPKATRAKAPKSSTSTQGTRTGSGKGAGMDPMDRNKVIAHFNKLDPPVRGPEVTAKIQALLNLEEATPIAKLSAAQGLDLMGKLGIKTPLQEQAEANEKAAQEPPVEAP